MSEVDYSQIISDLIARTAQQLASSLADGAKSTVDQIRLRLGSTFTRYLDQQVSIRSQVRTILYRDKPRFLYDFYVPQDLRCENDVIEHVDGPALFAASKATVIVGTGGSGKSILQRHLFLDTMAHSDYVPFFIELRSTNAESKTLEHVLADQLDLSSIGLGPEAIYRGFRKGVFALFLDGLDEVTSDRRDAISSEIRAFAARFPKTPLVVSSRPDDRFVGWDGFQVFRVEPFDLDKIRELLARLDYDDGAKARFLADVEDSLYGSHESFLSNPLLLTIMLMTYSHNASVPNKNHLFYAQIFDALWNTHDATKDGYKRALRSRLDKDAFIRVLEAMSFQAYWEGRISLTQDEAYSYLRVAQQLCGFEFDPEHYLDDLLRAVCVLVRDGLQYTYTHRSFQEYYAARFLLHADSVRRGRAYGRVVGEGQTSLVLELMWEMQREVVENELLIPTLIKLRQAMEGTISQEAKAAEFAMFFSTDIVFEANGNVHHSAKNPEAATLDFIAGHYFDPTWWRKRRQVSRSSATERSYEVIAALQASGFGQAIVAPDYHKIGNVLLLVADMNHLFAMETAGTFLETLETMSARRASRERTLDELLFGEPAARGRAGKSGRGAR